MGFWENVKQFNERWNDLPRRGAIVLMVLLALLAFAGLFSYIAPSVIAMVLAWVIHPVAKRLENVFRKIKLPAKLASLIAVIVMYGIVSFILFWIGARVVEEMRSLIAALPGGGEVWGFLSSLWGPPVVLVVGVLLLALPSLFGLGREPAGAPAQEQPGKYRPRH